MLGHRCHSWGGVDGLLWPFMGAGGHGGLSLSLVVVVGHCCCWWGVVVGSYHWSCPCSEEQRFGNPCEYMAKGLEGRGQGMNVQPLPLTEGKDIPSLLLGVSPVMFVGICHITNMLSTNKCFPSQQPPSS